MSGATIALLGQPNSGKSTLFNALTGLRQHVGNWPGKTVEKKEGSFFYKGMECAIADLPGSYSLTANSDEELITRDYIASGKADVVCILADSSQLERSLFMTADYAGIDVPSFLVLNMADVAAEQGKTIDIKSIEKKIGIPVLLFSATEGKKYEPYYETMERAVKEKSKINVDALEVEYEKIEGYNQLKDIIPEGIISGFTSMWLSVKALEGDKQVLSTLKANLSSEDYKKVLNICNSSQGAIATGSSKFRWIDGILDGSVSSKKESIALGKLDQIYLSRIWGKPAVILTVLLGLIASFIPALPFMGLGQGIAALKAPVSAALSSVGAPDILLQLVCTVLIQSFSYIVQMLGFVFGVTLVFGLLEEVGVISALFTGGNLSAAFNDAMSGAGAASNLNEILLANVSKAEALAFIFAMTFNMPCVVALAATFQETYSVKWTARIALYYTGTALLLAAVAYRIGLLIF